MFEEGAFSECKRARFVLLKKKNKSEGELLFYRPICLLDEEGKLLERIIMNRLKPLGEERVAVQLPILPPGEIHLRHY